MELAPRDVQYMFTAIVRARAALGHSVSPSTLRWIYATIQEG